MTGRPSLPGAEGGAASPAELERTSKRRKAETEDLPPEAQDEAGRDPSGSPQGLAPGRVLWGEVDAPPRWTHGRRRSGLRQQGESFYPGAAPPPPVPPYLPPDLNWASRTRSSARFATGSGADAAQPSRGTEPPERLPPRPPRPGCGPPPTLPLDFGAADLFDDELPLPRGVGLKEREEAGRSSAADALRHHSRMLEQADAAAQQAEADLAAMQAEMQAGLFSQLGRAREAGRAGPPPPGFSAAAEHALRLRQERRQRGLGGLGWAPGSIAEAMAGMLADGGPLSGAALGSLQQHVAAVRQALGAMAGPGRLPAHLLLSDRDFDENDYEALLALDEGVQSRRGASAEQIEAVPTAVVGAGGAAPGCECEARCPICLEDLVPGAVLRRLPCRHSFHRACLDRWLGHRATCPICQQGLPGV